MKHVFKTQVAGVLAISTMGMGLLTNMGWNEKQKQTRANIAPITGNVHGNGQKAIRDSRLLERYLKPREPRDNKIVDDLKKKAEIKDTALKVGAVSAITGAILGGVLGYKAKEYEDAGILKAAEINNGMAAAQVDPYKKALAAEQERFKAEQKRFALLEKQLHCSKEECLNANGGTSFANARKMAEEAAQAALAKYIAEHPVTQPAAADDSSKTSNGSLTSTVLTPSEQSQGGNYSESDYPPEGTEASAPSLPAGTPDSSGAGGGGKTDTIDEL